MSTIEPIDFDVERRRVEGAYAARASGRKGRLYHWTCADAHTAQYRLREVMRRLLLRAGVSDLGGLEILDVGCGHGAWLRTLLDWGADAARLHGIDVIEARVREAQRRTPEVDVRLARGGPLPFPDRAIDLVFAQTVFSSILDGGIRASLAGEMARVLAPGGRIFIYDFWIADPRNRDVIGIEAREVRRWFPGRAIESTSLTLAPPLARAIARRSPLIALAAEALLPFLRTHRIHVIR